MRLRLLPTMLIGLSVLGFSSSNAQVIEAWRIGGFFNLGRLDYTANLRTLPGIPSCCPLYEDGSGSTYTLGLSWGLPVLKTLAWEGRLAFSHYNGKLEADEYELVTAGRDTITATFGHSIEVTQPALSIDALFALEPLSRIELLGGMRWELMLGGTYHQEEIIRSPDNISFENDQRRRLVYDGDIPMESALHFSLVGGVRYELPLNKEGSVVLTPEILFWQDFVDVMENHRWRANGFRFGLGLQILRHKGTELASPLGPSSEDQGQGQSGQESDAESAD